MWLIIRTLTLNPFIGVELAAVIQTFILVFIILFNKDYRFNEIKSIKNNILKLFQLFGEGLLAIFGTIFLDISIMWIFGSWTYADWRFQLPNIIISLYMGIQCWAIVLFRKGNLADVIFSIVSPISIGLFVHWWVSAVPVMGNRMEEGLLILIIVLFFFFILSHLLEDMVLKNRNKVKNTEEPTKKYWDIRESLYRIFNRKLITIVWVLACIQGMLNYNGFSILSF